jgi:hypothetical protein
VGRKSRLEPLLEPIRASEVARERLKAVLLTLSGDWSVADALDRLLISRTRFQDLRRRMLKGALAALEPGPRGRPAKMRVARSPQVARLEAENASLKLELRMAQTSLELSEGLAGAAVRRRLRAQLERGR